MELLVVGTIGLDTIETPRGRVEGALGGSAVHFSLAASLFTGVRLVAVAGEDFPEEYMELLQSRRIDLAGMELAAGNTFAWSGSYMDDLNEALTHETALNVLAGFDPKLPPEYKNTPYVFLANIDPVLQARVLDQIEAPRLVACDTMNFWIEGQPEEVRRTLSRVDVLFINDREIRDLSGLDNVIEAAARVREWGPSTVVVKRGEYGVIMFGDDEVFAAPAYPLTEVTDPTGAGDSFGGGFMGYLAGRNSTAWEDMCRAAVVGTAVASYNVQGFSVEGVRDLRMQMIEQRYEALGRLTRFGDWRQ